MLLNVDYLSPIWRYRGERIQKVCVWVGVMIERERVI